MTVGGGVKSRLAYKVSVKLEESNSASALHPLGGRDRWAEKLQPQVPAQHGGGGDVGQRRGGFNARCV